MADIRTDSGSPERVALDLAHWIAEESKGFETFKNRSTLLDLYAECLAVTRKVGSAYKVPNGAS
ncbi:MAG: hypothetical protein NVS3B5_19190 [Sphingomicrobium sp.]